MNKKLKIIISAIIVLILIAINLAIFISYNKDTTEQENNKNIILEETLEQNEENIMEENQNDDILYDEIVDDKISKMSDGERIKAYFGKFVETIEDQEYEQAYKYLNEDFRKNYFPSLEEFTEYVENKFPKSTILVKYNNIERKGEIFLLSVSLIDGNNLETNLKQYTVVVRENKLNDFKISFSKWFLCTEIEHKKGWPIYEYKFQNNLSHN